MNLISLGNQDHIHIFARHHRLTHFFEICSDALWKQGAFFLLSEIENRGRMRPRGLVVDVRESPSLFLRHGLRLGGDGCHLHPEGEEGIHDRRRPVHEPKPQYPLIRCHSCLL